MIKKCLFFVLLFTLFFGFGGTLSKAGPALVIDQACLSERSDYYNIRIGESGVAQVFTPTKDTLDSVLLELNTFGGQSKARVGVYNVTNLASPEKIAEKYIWVPENSENYISVDFTDVPMPSGIYMLSVEALRDDQPVYWIATDGFCYESGFAAIEGHDRNDLDMVFAVKGYDSAPVQGSSSTTQPQAVEPSAPDPTSSSAPSSQSATSSTAVDPGTSGNQSSNIDPVDPNSVVEKTTPVAGNTSEMNKESAYSDKLAVDKEFREQIAFVLNDIAKNRYKGGAFGLSGAVGRILTWPVFYGICGLALLLIILAIIRSIKRKKALGRNSKSISNSVAEKKMPESAINASQEGSKKPAGKPKKRKKIGWVILVLIILALSGYQSYRTYYAPYPDKKNEKKEVAGNETAATETEAPSTNSTAGSKKTTSTGSTQQSNTASSSTAPSSSSGPQPIVSVKENTIEYFIDIALAYQGVERWTSDFNVGYAPGALDNDLETCLDGFIRDFNNASSTAKLHKNREDADIKIYVVSPEEMVQYGGDDAGRGFAYTYKNSNNEDYKGEIFLRNQLPDDQKAKCYLIKHEMMHAVGFRGHSDLLWDGIMAVPSTGRNTENIMSEVDTKAIQMLYNISLPLKSTEEETRAYLNSHYPN